MIYRPDQQIELKSTEEVQKMRIAGKLLSYVVMEIIPLVKPGVTTIELDKLAYKIITDAEAKPAFLGYHGYPATLCTSINEEIVHGIPSERQLKDGDIISIDVGLIKSNFYSDMAITLPVGDVDAEGLHLIKVTKESLYKGIDKMRVGNRLGDISAAVQDHVESFEYSIVRDYSGHGIGRALHESPQILNYGRAGTGPRLKVGMVFAVEPMVNEGGCQTKVLDDDWTVVTIDGMRSAHFEHTIYIGEDGPEILNPLDI